MKRWLSGAMALIITLSFAQGGLALAAEAGEEVAGAPMEEAEVVAVSDIDALEAVDAFESDVSAGDTFDLPIDSETVTPEPRQESLEAPAEPSEGEAAAAQDAPRYAVLAAQAEVLEAPDGTLIATLTAEGAALVLNEAAEGWYRVALYTERDIITGYVAADALRVMETEAAAAYLDALAAEATVAAYQGDINRPLAMVACAFPEAEDTEAAEATEDAVEAEPAEAENPTEQTPDAEPELSEATEEAAPEPEAEAVPSGGESPEEGSPAEGSPAEAQTTEAGQAVPEPAAAPEATEAPEALTSANALTVVTEASENPDAAEETDDTASADPSGADEKTRTTDTTDAAADADQTTDAADGSIYATAAKGIELNYSEVSMGVKESYTGLKAKGATGTVTWSSSNEKVVSVDASTGALKGVKKGSAVITATGGDGKTATTNVKVKAAPKKIKFSPAKVSVGAGKTQQLKLSLGKGAASAGTVYTSSDEKVATVDETGLVTGVAAGSAVITARTYNKKEATCKLTVYSVPAPSAIKLPAKLSIGVKETRAQLPVELVPESGQSSCTAEIRWSSSNKKVVKVDPATGELKALKKGKATIVARTGNGLKAKCKVTVRKAPKKIALKGAKSSVDVGATVQFTVKLTKGSASGISYKSSNASVVTVDEDGVATAVAPGKVTITATTYNGKSATASLTVKGKSASGETVDDEDSATNPDVEVPEALKKLGLASYQNTYSADLTNEEKLEYVIYNAQNQLDKPYKYGSGYTDSDNPSGFDCSGLVYWCFNRAHIKLERSAAKQGYDNSYTKIADIDSLKRGDVVCFNTNSGDNDQSDHTGIYLGNGYFIHASSGKSKMKVCVQKFSGDSISSDYYKRTFSWGRRILN